MLFRTSLLLAVAPSAVAFQPVSSPRSSTRLSVVVDEEVDVSEKVKSITDSSAAFDPVFDKMVKTEFPGAISNVELETKVVASLKEKGFSGANTLLATSLCADELARQLEDDFTGIYGDNFNLGGLSGFPFAGNTGFGAMAAHIPDDGFCLLIYAPHVGISKDGVIGKVERRGIELVDNCCGSAIAASNYLQGITSGGAQIVTNLQQFSDFQQGAVQKIILPHGKRLTDAENRMKELPYALYDSQDVLMLDIFNAGCGGTKKGTALLGGIQINTAPDKLDYFLPLRFDYRSSTGEILDDLLPLIQSSDSSPDISVPYDAAATLAYLEAKGVDSISDMKEFQSFKAVYEASAVAQASYKKAMRDMETFMSSL